jgi:hypothetical protein
MEQSFSNALRQVFPPQSPLPDFDFVAATGAPTVEERKRGENNLNTRGEVKRLRANAERTSDPSRKKELLEMAANFEQGYQDDRQKKPYGFEVKLAETQFSNAKKELDLLVDDPQQKTKIKENSLYYQSLVRGVNRELNEEFSFFMGKDPSDGNFILTTIGHGEKAREVSQRPSGEKELEERFEARYFNPLGPNGQRKEKEFSPIDANDSFSRYENPQKAFEEYRTTGNMPKDGLRPQPKVSQPDWEESLRPVE